MTRIVVRAPNWLGDIVMALPAIAAVRAAHPGAQLAVAAPAPFADVCAAVPGVDAVVPLRGSGLRAIGAHAEALADRCVERFVLAEPDVASREWRRTEPEGVNRSRDRVDLR